MQCRRFYLQAGTVPRYRVERNQGMVPVYCGQSGQGEFRRTLMTDVPGPAAVLRAIGRARERDDFEAALLFIAPESLDQGERVTREDWRRKWASMRDASPDLEIVPEQSVAEGEWIAHRYLPRGTHTGGLFCTA